MVSPCMIVLMALASITAALSAADRNLADGLATAGTTLAAKGNSSQAREMFYKALAYDEDCPDALFELAKIFEKEGNTPTACDFYQRAALVYAQDNKPATTAKRVEAERRVKALSPSAPRLTAVFEEYAQDLDRLVKKAPDTLTIDAASDRVTELKLSSVLAPEKMPKFLWAQKAASSGSSPPTATLPDVERDLKALGWSTITGVWIKKAAGVYETTNGKLEAAKTNGTIDLWVHSGFTGSVKACVRNGFVAQNFMDLTLSGYGVMFKGKECREYAPNEMVMKYFNGSLAPAMIKAEPINEASPKHHATVSINNEGVLDFNVNDKRKSVSNNKLPKNGGFMIEVSGTAVIENPRCV